MTLDAIIECPKGTRNKIEFDEKVGRFRFSRMLYSSVQYPGEYGYFPNTLASDGDPLDVIVLSHEPTFSGCIIEVRPVGILKLTDGKDKDNKVLAVPVRDAHWNHIHKLSQVPVHILNEVRNFFEIYKVLEKKKVKVHKWDGHKETIKSIKRAQKRFENSNEK
jgi:inorganic pyrophosphatase